MNSKLTLAAAVALQANALCSFNDYETYIPAFFQGFQTDIDSETTDCYISAVTYATSIASMNSSFSNF